MPKRGWFRLEEVKRRGGQICRALVPSDGLTERDLSEYTLGEVMKGQTSRPRSRKHNSLYWVLCTLIADNSSLTRDQVHQLFKHATGHSRTVELKSGERVTIYGSTAFENMDQKEFGEFYASVQTFIETELLPGVNSDDLKREIAEMAGLTPRPQ